MYWYISKPKPWSKPWFSPGDRYTSTELVLFCPNTLTTASTIYSIQHEVARLDKWFAVRDTHEHTTPVIPVAACLQYLHNYPGGLTGNDHLASPVPW